MKEGLLFENDELVFYKNGEPYHAGVIEVDGSIYYISAGGKAVKGEHIIHGVMTNGIIPKGTYTFDDDYKLVAGSYIAPKKRKKKKKKQLATQSTRSPRSRKRLLRKIKKAAFKIIPAVLGLVFVVVFAVYISQQGHGDPNPSGTKNPSNGTLGSATVISLPTFNEEVLLCSEAAKLAFDHQMDIADAIAYGTPYRPFVFKYQFVNCSGVLYISENSDMTNAVQYSLPGDQTHLEIDNLKTGTTYYYLVRVNEEEHIGSFTTARSNRFLNIPDTVNMRDIGGYKTLDGKVIKQGLLIRGTELDGLVNSEYFPSSDAIRQMQETFGFVYDMDLRSPEVFLGSYYSRLGNDVGHMFYDAPQYGQVFSQGSIPSLRAIFQDLADPEKYPMYMHCTWGMDRAGTIIFLLQGVLNVSEEDMILEYKQTSYVHPAIADNHNMDIIIAGLAPYEGNTLQEKIVSFLTTVVGVEEEEIQAIRSILLDEAA